MRRFSCDAVVGSSTLSRPARVGCVNLISRGRFRDVQGDQVCELCEPAENASRGRPVGSGLNRSESGSTRNVEARLRAPRTLFLTR